MKCSHSSRILRLGNNLELQRGRANMTQEDLAHMSGLSKTTIHNIESGKAVPSLVSALMICRALKLPVDQVFYLRIPYD